MARVDRLLRWVWLINGVLLLAMLVLGGGGVLIAFLMDMGGGTQTVPAAAAGRGADHGARDAEPVRYDPPIPVRGTDVRVVLVRRGSGYAYTNEYSSSGRGEAAIVNVAFLDAGGVRLLLDRPAYIRRVAFPGHEDGEFGDSTRRLRSFVYEMAPKDTNGDGALGDSDRRSLYVSGLDGRGLRQVLPDGYELRDWSPQPDGSILATALLLAPGADGRRMPERAFIVDPAGAVRPYAQLDSAMDRAGTIIGAK
jgi:hypothetical protein